MVRTRGEKGCRGIDVGRGRDDDVGVDENSMFVVWRGFMAGGWEKYIDGKCSWLGGRRGDMSRGLWPERREIGAACVPCDAGWSFVPAVDGRY